LRKAHPFLLLVIVLFVCSCSAGLPDRWAIEQTIDDFHDAAARADGDRYFSHLAEDAVFIGTDPTERWGREAFVNYCEPYFEQGIGWTYVPLRRHVVLRDDGSTAWFDELLDSEKYGVCRGTGTVRRVDGRWVIDHYALSLTVPNDVALDVVAIIRDSENRRAGLDSPH